MDVPYLSPSFPVGNFQDLLKFSKHFDYILEDLYYKLTKVPACKDFGGIFLFGDPVLLVLSPQFAKNILVKDFHHFTDRGIYYNELVDPLSANLFFISGLKWKRLREKFTPTFTTGKLKTLFFTIKKVGDELKDFLEPIALEKRNVDIKELMGRFMTDIIGSVAYGVETNSIKDSNSEFRAMGKTIMNFSKLKALKIVMASAFPEKARTLGIRWFDKRTSEYFMNVIRDTISHRKETQTKRQDFVQILMDLEESGYDKSGDPLTFLEIAAQAFIFFLAGFETSSTTLTFALYLLAESPDYQDEARKNVQEVLKKHNYRWSYEALMEMNFVGQIIEGSLGNLWNNPNFTIQSFSETLRMYPPVAQLHRTVVKDYQLPNGSYLPKGTGVFVPVLSFHRDSENFPDPMNFNPNRFNQESKSNIAPFSYLPFGEGMRNCIGMR